MWPGITEVAVESAPRTHLDLGCGTRPRNPYNYERLFGVDIRHGLQATGVEEIRAADLSQRPIPFPDRFFDSVSAYDFLEHVPRVAGNPADGSSRFPFIELMGEIWRVLRPGGLFYAVTPAFPHEKAFRDPTHVNILTRKSVRYFTRPELGAKMYGFRGDFGLVRQDRIHIRGNYEPHPASAARLALRVFDGMLGRRSHLVWELRAIKGADE